MNQLLLSTVMPEMESFAARDLSFSARVTRPHSVRPASIQDVQPFPFIAHAAEIVSATVAFAAASFITFATDGFASSSSAFVFAENGDA